MLKFGNGNAKLNALSEYFGRTVWTFTMLSGHTCPYAKECNSRAVQYNGKLKVIDGPHTKFRCFSASSEARLPNVYNLAKHNTDAIFSCKSVHDIFDLILSSLPGNGNDVYRIHVGGDFKTRAYFDAWADVAAVNPQGIFYAYTKSLPFWVDKIGILPKNFILTASYGGYRDDLIAKHNLRFAKVVFSEEEANGLGLEIDHDDTHAACPDRQNESFALLLHGVQPKGSLASESLKKLKGKGSYGKRSKANRS